MQSLYLSAIAALFATVLLVLLLRPVARTLDLVDRPGGRKQHSGIVPVVGGLAMFMGLAFGLSVLPTTVRPPASFSATAFAFVCLGLLDDRLNLSSIVRLIAQMTAVFAMAVIGGLGVHYVGAPFGFGTVIFVPWAALTLTILLVVGAVNALNMVDGIDGLAGSMGLVALLAVAGVCLYGANTTILGVAVVLGAAVAGFLLFNLPLPFNTNLRIFMGDAGSMLLGFSLAWMMVLLSQEPDAPVAPVTLLWFAAIPIFDMVSTAAGRILRGQSPMSADSTHLHHRLLKKGFSVRMTLITLVALALLWVVIGLFIDLVFELPEWLSLGGFLVAGGVTVWLVERLPDFKTG
jgi:UDP-GlcNAc:undecaprenyl-phosphate GlcNAc-1-phosphate transferase